VPRPLTGKTKTPIARHGLARVLSKLGVCSRSQAEAWIRAGRVSVDGRVVHDVERPSTAQDRIAIDGVAVDARERIYLMLNKPRGHVTTTSDEHDRKTVYALLADAGLPWVAPVGRLDKASEGLLLFSNDSAWAARITAPDSHLDKTYHVQIDCRPDDALLAALKEGTEDRGERLSLKSVRGQRRGELNAFDIGVLRLVRVAIGPLELGDLAKGRWRRLAPDEFAGLAVPSSPNA